MYIFNRFAFTVNFIKFEILCYTQKVFICLNSISNLSLNKIIIRQLNINIKIMKKRKKNYIYIYI